MPIDTNRISNDIEAIAGFSEAAPHVGYSRPTFSPSWSAARNYVIAQAESANCKTQIDAAGNIHIRPDALPWQEPAWLSGSHIDSVPTGGKYDGVAGIVAPLEILRAAHEDGKPIPLELIIFAEEEGTTFGLGMLGSRAWVGDLNAGQLDAVRNGAGQSYLEAGQPCGVRPDTLPAERFDRSRYIGLVEIHIEQGPSLWKADKPLAIVTAIAGRKQYHVTYHGIANHAGSTSMADRHDALTAAAPIIIQVEAMAKDLSPQTVATVGRLNCRPNAVNVISEFVEFTIDLRSPDDELLAEGDERIRKFVSHSAERRDLKWELVLTEDQPAVALDAEICGKLRKAAGDVPTIASGALHDAAIMAPHLPTAMIFIGSKDGISHNPLEESRMEDIAAAATLLRNMISDTQSPKKRTALRHLNTLNQIDFVAICGPLFEHSPWIAERTWRGRPFPTLAALHDKLCDAMNAASDDEKLKLIASHPDLVGKLARQGELTRESTGEQAAAGLTKLTPEDIAAFDRFNAAYRDKFDFPFIICARENKKDAILKAFPLRLANNRQEEIQTALAEIAKIAKLRLLDAVTEE